jgi:hypothetical protein
MRFKVQVRQGPDGSPVEYYDHLSLREARRRAETVPEGGMAGIWDENRLIRAWISRENGELKVVTLDRRPR